ncbi:protein NRT1/ PTR FAMILY 2.14 [Carex littledalei]|uniref:Protein NRT1/ PTR FAMILY 2.14 n=1 Tax=Carex littledalei TaxID=544730 RepID=A0A833VYC2_9POAL|nr:protein NRT1/ PTR FAMILY 2.14 [Carex littledalei]
MEGIMNCRGNPLDPRKHGGVRATLFLYTLVVARSSINAANINLISLFRSTHNMSIARSVILVTNFGGATWMLSILGAFIADSYIQCFKVILFFGPFEILIFEWMENFPAYLGLFIIALGEGFMRTVMPGFGGEQFNSDDPSESELKIRFSDFTSTATSFGAFLRLVLVVFVVALKKRKVHVSSENLEDTQIIKDATDDLTSLELLPRTKDLRTLPLVCAGIGFVFAMLGTCVAPLVERKKRMADDLKDLSFLWSLPQFICFGLMEVLSFVGLMEFFNNQLPVQLKALSSSMMFCIVGTAIWLDGALVSVIGRVTRRGDKENGWLDGMKFESTRIDLFFGFLTVVEFLSFFIFLFCARRYLIS